MSAPSPYRRWLRRTTWPLRTAAARFGLVDEEMDRMREAVATQIAAVRREIAEVRTLLEDPDGVLARSARDLELVRRENAAILRLLRSAGAEPGPEPPPEAPAGRDPPPEAPPGPSSWISRQTLFAEIERGSREEVKSKIEGYLQCFEGRGPVVDLGCGRGEFLELATERGLAAYGVDLDPDAVELCRSLGLDAREEDLFAHLRSVADGSIGGVFSAQVVEHLPPDLVPVLMSEIARVLLPGGAAVVETPNPSTFATHVRSFWRDPTHLRPVPEATLGFAARSAGLLVDRVLYTAPCPERDRLQPVEVTATDPEVRRLAEGINAMTERLNDLLYGYQDYAVVLRKPAA